MKIDDTFTVEIDGATFEFEQPYANEDPAGIDKAEYAKSIIAKKLKRISGVFDKDGTPVSIEKMKELSLPWSVVAKLVNAYGQKMLEIAGIKPEAEEKKELAIES